MPLNLDSCITGIFVPGNIGASSGQPPIVRVMPPRLPATATVAIHESANATDLTDLNIMTVGIVETATAADFVDTPTHEPIKTGNLTEAAAAADNVDWVGAPAVGYEFYGVLGIAGPIPPSDPAPTIIYIEV